ncbi:hypothetical protein Aduo_012357 [Ancylostoma duodenale]
MTSTPCNHLGGQTETIAPGRPIVVHLASFRPARQEDLTGDHGEPINDGVAEFGIEYKSPLAALPRIPRKEKFRTSENDDPATPAVPQRTQSIRVTLAPGARRQFEQLTAGLQISASEKIAMLKDLPLISSPLRGSGNTGRPTLHRGRGINRDRRPAYEPQRDFDKLVIHCRMDS